MSSSADNAKKRLADEVLANPFSQSFIPKKKVIFTHGKTTINVYPDITTDMGDHERSLAFNINKTAVQNAFALPHASKLQILGEKHNCSNIIDVETEQWKSTGLAQLKDPVNLTIVSYHNAAGAMSNDATDNAGALKPLIDGAVANCRPPNIIYAKVKGIMDFSSLNKNKPLSLSATFFLRLPTDDIVINNAAGNPRTVLNTFNGPSDWLTILDSAAFSALIFTHDESIEYPFDLLEPTFESPAASVNIESKMIKLTNDIMKIAYNSILERIFKQTCPNFIDDPFDTLNKVHQESILPNGTSHRSSVREYYNMIQIVLTTFPRDANADWSSNPFRKFVENLSPAIRDRMESNGFRKHIQSVSTRPHDQSQLIQEGLEAACLAETQLAKQRLYIQDTMKEVHGFISLPIPPDEPPTALTSAAESTLSKFRDPKKMICWGCGKEDDHYYYDRRSKTVTCPHGDDPEVQKRAELVRKDFNERQKTRRGKKKYPSKNHDKDKEKSKSDDSLAKAFAIILQSSNGNKSDFASILASAIKSSNNQGNSSGDHVVLMMSIQPCLTTGNLPQLPIPITNTLPHIILKLGTSESSFNPGIPAIVDTGAALCVGFSGYIMSIAKAYPELVKSITLAKDRYSPIILSGVVSKDKTEATRFATNLPAVVEFHLPYLTHNGSPTSIKFAVGEDVSVNCLLGMSFISTARLIIDAHDNVVESKLLDTPPFEIDFRAPSRSAPNLVPRTASSSAKSLAVINQIDAALAFIADHQSSPPSFQITQKRVSAVTFDADTFETVVTPSIKTAGK
jgi:hypothetical protein